MNSVGTVSGEPWERARGIVPRESVCVPRQRRIVMGKVFLPPQLDVLSHELPRVALIVVSGRGLLGQIGASGEVGLRRVP